MASQSEQRAELVAVLDNLPVVINGATVTLSATATAPPTVAAYAVWPQWIASRPTAMCVKEIDWHVLVALPGGDPQDYVAGGDALEDTVSDALGDYQLTRVEPVLINVADSGNVPALRFSLTI